MKDLAVEAMELGETHQRNGVPALLTDRDVAAALGVTLADPGGLLDWYLDGAASEDAWRRHVDPPPHPSGPAAVAARFGSSGGESGDRGACPRRDR
jgi:hypothetical protein